MARFYNPFKAHVISDKGAYYVRRFRFFGWQYRHWNEPDRWSYGRSSLNRLSKVHNAFLLKNIPKNKLKVLHGIPD